MARILLAEDDETMVGLLTTLLRMDGYDVQALDTGGDVAALVQQDCPDVLLLDVHLSGRNGLDVLDAIRRNDEDHRVRVVMISGLNVREESFRHGADAFLLKPFTPDDLARTLRNNLPASL